MMHRHAPERPLPMTTMDDLAARAKLLAERRELLAELVHGLNRGIEALKADSMGAVRAAIDAAAAAWEQLLALVEANPQIFRKPRSVQMHGLEFGFKKGAGRLVIDDEDRTVRLIRKHLPERADVLIATREVPVKKAMLGLDGAELAKVGARIDGTGDMPFIKPADSSVDKLVRALVKASVEGDGRTDEEG